METHTDVAQLYVVDDSVDLCDSVKFLLGSIDIEPIICHSAQEFLDVFEPNAPSCIILDVRMPQMSGIRLQKVLNDIAPHAAIIFMSAHGDIPMSVSVMKAGAQNFLEKPYDPQRLLDAVQVGLESATNRFQTYSVHHDISEKLTTLTPREREVLLLVIEGLPSQVIGRKLGMSVKTVDVHRTRIKSKTDAESISTLVRDILRYRIKV